MHTYPCGNAPISSIHGNFNETSSSCAALWIVGWHETHSHGVIQTCKVPVLLEGERLRLVSSYC